MQLGRSNTLKIKQFKRYKIQEVTHKTLPEHMETEKRQRQTIHTRQDNKRQSKISSITMNS